MHHQSAKALQGKTTFSKNKVSNKSKVGNKSKARIKVINIEKEKCQQDEPKKAGQAIVCPISLALISSPCNVNSCMWNAKGNCCHSSEITEIELGEFKGMLINDSLLELRRAKSNIIKIMVLDKYLDFVVTNNILKDKLNRRINKSSVIKEMKMKSRVHNPVFNLSGYHFCLSCNKKVFADFLKLNPDLSKYKLATLIGLREHSLSAVSQRFSRILSKATRSGNKNKKSPNIKKVQ